MVRLGLSVKWEEISGGGERPLTKPKQERNFSQKKNKAYPNVERHNSFTTWRFTMDFKHFWSFQFPNSKFLSTICKFSSLFCLFKKQKRKPRRVAHAYWLRLLHTFVFVVTIYSHILEYDGSSSIRLFSFFFKIFFRFSIFEFFRSLYRDRVRKRKNIMKKRFKSRSKSN